MLVFLAGILLFVDDAFYSLEKKQRFPWRCGNFISIESILILLNIFFS